MPDFGSLERIRARALQTKHERLAIADNIWLKALPGKLSFMSLPPEVRMIVYGSLFADSKIRIHEDSFMRRSLTATVVREGFPLLCTCRLVYGEAWPVLVESTALQIETHCPEAELPLPVQRFYLPHIQHLLLGTMLVHFPAEHLPNLKRLTILDKHLVQHGRRSIHIRIQSDDISTMIPSIIGAKDHYFVRKCIEDLEELEAWGPENLSMDNQSILKTWQQIKALPMTVATIITFRVALRLYRASGDSCHSISVAITFSLNDKSVLRREILDRTLRGRADTNSVHELLMRRLYN